MDLVEVRDLDGPNIFLLEPAIKIEFAARQGVAVDPENIARRLGLPSNDEARKPGATPLETVATIVQAAVAHLHRLAGSGEPRTVAQELEMPGHLAVAFGWDHRRFALQLAQDVAAASVGESFDLDSAIEQLRALRGTVEDDDRPLMIRDADRAVRAIAVTGTNGKTTTTRLIAHTLRAAGLRVGWCSSSGVYIEGREVVQGDYSGPSGARRVLLEPGLDAGVLETARGGILLRGTAYESNDVSIFTNISADHLSLQGILTVEGLARVKSVVCRVTRADGRTILNADDPLVMGATTDVRAPRILFSQQSSNPVFVNHIASGGTGVLANEESISFVDRSGRRRLVGLADVPITHGGAARHMVENAIAAAAGCLGFGLDEDAIRAGLESFENSPELNEGRLNIFAVNGTTVVVDYAHNEAGLSHLLALARRFKGANGRLISIIGTAGDRTEQSLREIGRIAATQSDTVIVKGTERYQRGRSLQAMIDLYCEGIASAGSKPAAIEPLELPAVVTASSLAGDGDVIAIMAQEQIPEILDYLRSKGAVPVRAGAR